ncbi:MAG: SEL1-like repeat protein [Pseudolabrys sp.]|nr:SEL1-like repeat protein [Pseudolabrys sp.]MBV9261166.1 SEL1-like repeat protein [Pseudolabrys sp.]
MKLGVPWSVKGIRPEARETAKEAARRAGMPLSEWLNTAIINSASEEGIDPADFELGGNTEVAAMNARLDDLTRKIDRLATARSGPEAYAPPHVRAPAMPSYIPPAPQMHLVRAASPFSAAAAEIAARQRALNGQPPLAAAHAQSAPVVPPLIVTQAAPAMVPQLAPAPAQDLSGLEDQLRRITDQIETLRRPGVEEAINALRGELAEIGHALNDAMPRQALDTIEQQVQDLTQRVAEGRDAGIDRGAIANIEHGLTEVREALAHLQPAESLVGFNDAIAILADKMDLIVAQKDPATLQQLESAITTLRGVSAHIASNETVRQLSDDVALLAEKVDRIANASAAGEALNSLEQRISALADALAARSQNGNHVPPGLEALVNSLSSKIEQLQMSRGDGIAANHLEDRIVKLVERLDASDNRLSHLEAIERGLADLLIYIEEMRSQKSQGGPRDGDVYRQDVARAQDALDKLTGTMGHIVDRLAAIEQGVLGRHDTPLELTEPVEIGVGKKIAARAVPMPALLPESPIVPLVVQAPPPPQPPAPAARAPVAPPPPAAAPAETPKRGPLPAKGRAVLNPGLPPDLPLEPGSGHPARGNLAARIAASEAALGPAAPPAEEPQGKSGFLAAARRAAQAALKQPAKPVAPPPQATPRSELWSDIEGGNAPSLCEKLTKRIKSLFIAASVIAIVVGGVQIAADQFGLWPSTEARNDLGLNGDINVARRATEKSPTNPVAAAPEIVPSVAPSAPPALTANSPATVPVIDPQIPTTALNSVPALTGGASLNNDITGSISKPAIRPVSPAAPDIKLPIAIGGAALRTAAAQGDPAAAYEIAVRFAEGRGISSNAEEAARWFDKAARGGLAPAQFRLGSLYEKGSGVKKDLGQARKLYAAAAAQGNAKAMHNLAVLYAEGIDGKPDYAQAVGWFQKAANLGVSDSQYNLGILCARGLGTEKNLADSYKWFALAAERGDREAGKKRDEIALRLEAKGLAAAQLAVKAWVAETQPDAATTVPVPEGGWDHASSDNPPPARPKRIGAYEIGKR